MRAQHIRAWSTDVSRFSQKNNGSLHRRYASQIPAYRRSRRPPNPTKCVFGVTSGKFLGYIVTKRGIKANPEQIKLVLNITSPKCKKDVHKLTRRIAPPKPFHFKVFRTMPQFLQHLEEKCWLYLDRRMWGSLATIEKLPNFCTAALETTRWRKIFPLPCDIRTFCKCRPCTRKQRKAITNLLCQQSSARCGNLLQPTGKISPVPHYSHPEAQTIFPKPP